MKHISIKLGNKGYQTEERALTFGKGSAQMFWIALLSVLYLARDLGGVAFPDIVFSGLCAAAFLATDIGTSLGIFMFTSALTLPLNEIRILYLAILIIKMAFSVSLHIDVKMLVMTVGLLLLQLIDLTLFSNDNIVSTLYDYVVGMLFVIIPLIWYCAAFSPEDYRRALLCYVAGVILGGTTILLLTADAEGWSELLSGEGNIRLGALEEKTAEGMQTGYNANQLSGMFTIVAAIILVLMDQKRLHKVLGFGLLGYSLFVIILTRSRTGILAMLMIAAVYFLVTAFRRKKLLSAIFTLAGMALLAALMIRYFPELVENVMDRFEDREDITNGRADLFVLYMQAWSEDFWCFFFGYGIGSYKNMVDIWQVPHNAIADILICWGLTGLLLLVGILAMQGLQGIKAVKKEVRVLALLPAIVAAVICMGGQYLTTGFPHFRLCFLLLAAKALTEVRTEETAMLGEHNE